MVAGCKLNDRGDTRGAQLVKQSISGDRNQAHQEYRQPNKSLLKRRPEATQEVEFMSQGQDRYGNN